MNIVEMLTIVVLHPYGDVCSQNPCKKKTVQIDGTVLFFFLHCSGNDVKVYP